VLLSDRVVMMTNGSGGNDRRDPRHRSAAAAAIVSRSPASGSTWRWRAELLDFLYRKQMKEAA